MDMKVKVYCQHTHKGEVSPVICKTYDEGVDLVHNHFLSYGFELVGGLAIDPLEEDGDKVVFSDVIIDKGRVASFKHYDSEGPIGKVLPFKMVGGKLTSGYSAHYLETSVDSFYERLVATIGVGPQERIGLDDVNRGYYRTQW